LQPHPNNNLRKLPSERLKGIIGTVILHSVLFAFLILVSFTITPPSSEEGILVNFGTDETGLGMIEPSSPSGMEESTPSLSNNKSSEEEALLTQNNEEAPEVKKTDPDAERKKLEKTEADRIIKEQRETERIQREQAEIERKKIEAEKQRQTDIMNRTKNALSNSRNSGTNSTSEGIAGGTGNQGVITGSVNSNNHGEGSGTGNSGISYSLQGRGYSSLPSPKYDYQGEGKVVVEVSVNRVGKVIQATAGIKGSTTLDEYLLRVAKEAAMEATFETKNDAPEIQRGTITYNFILK
jgi:colicin import membrane protein